MFIDRSEDTCRGYLEPFHDRLFAVSQYALKTFQEIPDRLRLPLQIRKRSFATTMWSYEMEAVESLFDGLPGVNLAESYESILVEVDGAVTVRFKKVNDHGVSASYPTPRAKRFNSIDQGEMFDAPLEWSAPIRVDLGYQIGEQAERLSIAGVWVVCRNGKHVAWKYELVPPGNTDTLISTIAPTVPTAPRIVPKDGVVSIVRTEGK